MTVLWWAERNRDSETTLGCLENAVEDVVERDEEYGDEPAADEEENEEGEHAHAVVELSGLVRQEVAENVAAVERGQRNEVEDEEKQVDEDNEVEKERDREERGKAVGGNAGNVLGDGDGRGYGGVSGGEDVLDYDQQDEGDGGGEQVAGWAGEGDEDVVAPIVFEVASGDRGGLGPTDKEVSIDQRDEREEDGADGVEVFEGIESDAAEHTGGGITEARGGPGVGALVHAESKD